jgi:hypothetical protein
MSCIALSRLGVAAILLIVCAPARADQAATMTAIALAESGGNTRATLPSGKVGRGPSHVGSQSGRPSSAHVAISLGDGTTIEARGQKYGAGFGRFTQASPQGANPAGEDSRGLWQINLSPRTSSVPSVTRTLTTGRLIMPRMSMPQISARVR